MSVDTQKAEVARAALSAGASMINDISALAADPEMIGVVARAGVPVILMHMRGTPQTMQDNPAYEDLIGEILAFLRNAIDKAAAAGVREDLTVVDPGIGFGKTFDDNLMIIRELAAFKTLGRPILLGTSNKAFIGRVLNKKIDDRSMGTMATIAAGVLHGADIVRVHDVGEAVDTVRMIDAITRGKVSNT
jgi:dihydropteroate synthase